jgi:hypothetical protein
VDGAERYPGSGASAAEVISLAEAYRKDAVALLARKRGGEPLLDAPGRLCAVHAIELYLNAFLIKLGKAPEGIRSSRHDLAEKAKLASAGGLVLRRRTAIHLATMTQRREYLVLRYEPEMGSLSQVTRLGATLEEIASKVKRAVLARGGARDSVSA